MLKTVWIRHGATLGNQKKRYIGTTDERLSIQGINKLQELQRNNKYPFIHQLFVSPLIRCKETAEILYQEFEYQVVEDFRECDFGEFENKNYQELDGNRDYQRWIDSKGTLPFPKGEHPELFQKRCVYAFEQLMLEVEEKKASSNMVLGFVVHGGTIMSIMEKLCTEKRNYFAWQIQNGEGFVCNYVGGKLELCYPIIY